MLLNKVIKVQLFPQIKKYEILFPKDVGLCLCIFLSECCPQKTNVSRTIEWRINSFVLSSYPSG